jgi:hypothetical protein
MGDVLSQVLSRQVLSRQVLSRQVLLSQVLGISARHDKPESWRRIVSGLGRAVWLAFCCAVLLCNGVPLRAQTPPPPAETEAEAEPETDNAVIDRIVGCLTKGQEAVLQQSQPVECVPFGKGVSRVASAESSKNINIAKICSDPADQRRLSGNAIKRIASKKDQIDPMGIRVIGGVYCRQLDLVGLDIPFSLVLDKSVFKDGVQGRNLHTKGDLSFDYSLMFGELFLARVHVEGTIFADDAVIQKMRLLDAEVHGSALFRYSLILDLAAFDTVQLSGELSVRNALFTYLLVQFSKVGGVLDLTDSRARCSFKIRKNEIGDIVAVNSGFGTMGPPPQKDAKQQYEWNSPPAGSKAADLLKSAADNMPPTYSDQSKICDHTSISYSPGSILITDTKVKSSFCLRSFHWLEGASLPTSYVTVQDMSVGTSASIDLADVDAASNDAAPNAAADMTHKLEILGLETGSLFLNFNPQPAAMYISGLKFDQVYAVKPRKVACFYEPNFSDSDTSKAVDAEKTAAQIAPSNPGSGSDPMKAEKQKIHFHSLGNDADPAGSSSLPEAEEVTGWLDRNLLATTQPFEAFVDVFQKLGKDDEAKELRVHKAAAELCLKARRLFGEGALFSDAICGRRSEAQTSASAAKASSAKPTSTADPDSAAEQTAKQGWWGWAYSTFKSWLAIGTNFVTVVLGVVLSVLADNGYHPEKVGYFVALSIVLFGLYFWLVLNAVGFPPKEKKTTILPFGFVFLFDRLLPAYQIREDHYNIESFFIWVSKTKAGEPGAEIMRRGWWNFTVVPANEGQRLRIERSLDVLKIIGLILAVFLVAAINAIFSH